MKINTINISEKLNLFKDYWSPKVVGELNNQIVKLAKFKGDFVRHKHDHEDELFFVISGKLFIEMDQDTIEVNTNEFIIIPKGVYHKPYAPEEVHVMLFEPSSTLNTGDTLGKLTVSKLDKI